MTDVGSQGIRGKRKSAYVAGATALLIVAAMLAGAGLVIGTASMLWLGLLLAAVAVVLLLTGRRVRRTPPSHPDHPRLTHSEDHPKDQDTP